MKTLIGMVLLGAVVGGIYLLNSVTRGKDGKSILNVARDLDIPVEMTHPEQRDIVRTVQAPGEVEAFTEVDIRSELVAKILEMPVEEGDLVQKGDLLCRLDDDDYRARVQSAEANVAKLKSLIVQAEADLEIAERDWEQAQRLREANANSEMEMANYRSALIKSRAIVEMRGQELIETQANLQSAREDLAKTVIEAPIAGVVSQRFAKTGEVVITGTMNNPGTRIMVISDLSKMQVRCRVDEADAPLVAADQSARIYLQSDTRRSVPGRVFRVGTKGTKPTGRDVVTFETLVLIDPADTGKLTSREDNQEASTQSSTSSTQPAAPGAAPRPMPGMTANIEIEVARRTQAVTVPVQAVVYRKRRDLPPDLVRQLDERQAALDPNVRQNLAEYIRLVFCVDDGKAHPRLVQTGISDATSVELLDSLTLTDTVVIGPYRSLDQLKDGSAVKQFEKPGAPPGGTAVAAGTTQDANQPASDANAPTAASQPAPSQDTQADGEHATTAPGGSNG